MISESTINGGCLCGRVRYSIDREAVISAHHCHCRDCQRTTGSGSTTFVVVADESFVSISGDPKFFSVVGTSGSSVTRGFCPDCGCPLYSFVDVAPGMKFVKAASLEDSSWVQPVSSFWTESAPPWGHVDESLQGFVANPEM